MVVKRDMTWLWNVISFVATIKVEVEVIFIANHALLI